MLNNYLHVELNNVQKWPESSMTVACNSNCKCDSEYVDKNNNSRIII